MVGEATPQRARRAKLLEAVVLDARSLVGSFFHSDGERQWQGVVVAEPTPGVYLCECFEWAMGEPTHQCLTRIEDMLDWRFYDDAEWMNSAFEMYVERRWKRQGEAREAEGRA